MVRGIIDNCPVMQHIWIFQCKKRCPPLQDLQDRSNRIIQADIIQGASDVTTRRGTAMNITGPESRNNG